MEIAEQLAVVGIQILFPVLAFNQDNGLSVLVDGIVYLFAFLDAEVAGELGNDFGRVEYIIAECLNHRHDKRCFGSLFGQNIFFELDNTVAQLLDLIFEVHDRLFFD